MYIILKCIIKDAIELLFDNNRFYLIIFYSQLDELDYMTDYISFEIAIKCKFTVCNSLLHILYISMPMSSYFSTSLFTPACHQIENIFKELCGIRLSRLYELCNMS